MSCVDMELQKKKVFTCIINIIKEIEYKRHSEGYEGWGMVFKRIEKLYNI